MTAFVRARSVIEKAVAERAFPAATLEVGRTGGVLWREAFGRLTYAADAPKTRDDTVFDLASLTKVIATTSIVMQGVERGDLRLDERIQRRLRQWTGIDRESVTIRDLLAHASGLTAWLPFYRDHSGRPDFEQAICTLPLEYPPRTQSIYSDLGFMLLLFLLEDAFSAPFDAQFELVRAAMPGAEGLLFTPPAAVRTIAAPTEVDPWRGRLLVGEVHDENTYALGGVSGHAGLFGTARAVGAFARVVLSGARGASTPLARAETVRTFVTRQDVPGSSRALGWDTMLPTSSCGTRMSAGAFGHTGFTGTSLWIDPERDLYVVLLTNRVHPTRQNEGIQSVRRAFHDAVMEAVTT
jgi:CubicO group peptidase (beta-lactamase class C family)